LWGGKRRGQTLGGWGKKKLKKTPNAPKKMVDSVIKKKRPRKIPDAEGP